MQDIQIFQNVAPIGGQNQQKKPPYASLSGDLSTRPVFKMRDSERMGGKIPVWEPATTGAEKFAQQLDIAAENAISEGLSGSNGVPENLRGSAFAGQQDYNQLQDQNAYPIAPKPFGFGDLVDMVNPLQHIPIVSHIYRDITGDEIRGISKIMGGAVFGGPLGVASGLVDAGVENETGRDITGHVVNQISHANTPQRDGRIDQYQQASATRSYQKASSLTNDHNQFANISPADQLQHIGRNFIANRSHALLGDILTARTIR